MSKDIVEQHKEDIQEAAFKYSFKGSKFSNLIAENDFRAGAIWGLIKAADRPKDLFYYAFRNTQIEELPMPNPVPALKPCPFCGGEAFLTGMLPTQQYYIKCDGCRASVWYDREDKAIGLWNMRNGQPIT